MESRCGDDVVIKMRRGVVGMDERCLQWNALVPTLLLKCSVLLERGRAASSADIRALAFPAQYGHRLRGIHQLVELSVAHGALLSLEDGLSALLVGAHTLVPARHARHCRRCIETDGALGRPRRSCTWLGGGRGNSGSSVYLEVGGQGPFPGCFEIADGASKRFLPRVGSSVHVQVALGVGSEGANGARKRLLSSVGSGVCVQVALGVGSEGADGARKRLLSSVGSGVCVQVALGVGSEDTDGARIRLLPSVGSGVSV
jgi:hypothetical protein